MDFAVSYARTTDTRWKRIIIIIVTARTVSVAGPAGRRNGEKKKNGKKVKYALGRGTPAAGGRPAYSVLPVYEEITTILFVTVATIAQTPGCTLLCPD